MHVQHYLTADAVWEINGNGQLAAEGMNDQTCQLPACLVTT